MKAAEYKCKKAFRLDNIKIKEGDILTITESSNGNKAIWTSTFVYTMPNGFFKEHVGRNVSCLSKK
jgi:hypothetical protein